MSVIRLRLSEIPPEHGPSYVEVRFSELLQEAAEASCATAQWSPRIVGKAPWADL